MIPRQVVESISQSVCAVGRSDYTYAALLASPPKKGEKMDMTSYKAIGTGFIVRDGWVLTNRHVVEAIEKDMRSRNEKNLDHWFVEFAYQHTSGAWTPTYKWLQAAMPLRGGTGVALDIALLKYTHKGGELPVKPVRFGKLDDIRVGADVAMCGYLAGDLLTLRLPGTPRSGPVLHAGIISGVAPYSAAKPRELRALLTDLYAGGGFSGSPLFFPATGHVIGLHSHGGENVECGVGVPVDEHRVFGLIKMAEEMIKGGSRTFRLTAAGDAVPDDAGAAESGG